MPGVGEASEAKKGSLVLTAYPQLTRNNYTIWAMKMCVVQQAQEVWEAVELAGDAYKKGGAEYRKDRLALTAIYQAILESLMSTLAGKDSAQSAWKTIEMANLGHERVREAKLQTLKRDFQGLKIQDDDTVEAFAGRISSLVSGIHGLREKTLDKIEVVRCFLRVAPALYMQLVTSIEQCVDLSTLCRRLGWPV